MGPDLTIITHQQPVRSHDRVCCWTLTGSLFLLLYHFHFKRIIKTNISNDARWQLNSAVCVCVCVCVCVSCRDDHGEREHRMFLLATQSSSLPLNSRRHPVRLCCAHGAAVARPYPLICASARKQLWLCCISPLFFSTIFSTVIYTVSYL